MQQFSRATLLRTDPLKLYLVSFIFITRLLEICYETYCSRSRVEVAVKELYLRPVNEKVACRKYLEETNFCVDLFSRISFLFFCSLFVSRGFEGVGPMSFFFLG